jgi:hypothetical protein
MEDACSFGVFADGPFLYVLLDRSPVLRLKPEIAESGSLHVEGANASFASLQEVNICSLDRPRSLIDICMARLERGEPQPAVSTRIISVLTPTQREHRVLHQSADKRLFLLHVERIFDRRYCSSLFWQIEPKICQAGGLSRQICRWTGRWWIKRSRDRDAVGGDGPR